VAQAVVALGNPGDDYRQTRHNVGHRVVDLVAQSLHKRFTRDGQAWLVRAEWRGEPLYLVKPISFVNLTGPPLARLGRRLALGPQDLVLVYDDIDLPVGAVRVRMRGSHGGHNGVRSIIEALGTEDIRRVKVGIGRPLDRARVAEWVLTPFASDELPAIEEACAQAANRVLELVSARARS
jgi:PTH1 family peptidyl-tRNA hydrolase